MVNPGRYSIEHALTEREREILLLICNGQSNQEIAARLHLTHGTAKWYASQIYHKLNVNNRSHAVTKAHELGLVTDTESPLSTPHKLLRIAPQPRSPEQKIHYLNSFDGVQIAYAISGEGPPFVEAAHHFNHLEYGWESPVYRHLHHEFMRGHTLIRYDERGTGLSQRNIEEMSFAAWVRDLEAVVEATGAKHFPLFGKSKAGSVAVAYAARHPESVSHLILLGAFARGYAHREMTPEQEETLQTKISLVKLGWESDNPSFRKVFAVNEFPQGPSELIEEMEKLIRVSNPTATQQVIRLIEAVKDVDVRDLARQVRVPTLMFHAMNDQIVPFEEGHLLASLIPGAEFVPLDTMNHLLVEGEPAWHKFQETLRRFLKS